MQGTQNQFGFLPEQYSDFPFAVFSEDWGFFGTTVLICLYAFVCIWSIHIASQAKDRFGAALAVGVGALLFWHAVFNIGMAMGVLPVVGITLPLFSYGGSSVLTMLMGLGLLMNVSMRRVACRVRSRDGDSRVRWREEGRAAPSARGGRLSFAHARTLALGRPRCARGKHAPVRSVLVGLHLIRGSRSVLPRLFARFGSGHAAELHGARWGASACGASRAPRAERRVRRFAHPERSGVRRFARTQSGAARRPVPG